MQVREILVFTSVDDQPVGAQMEFRNQTLDGFDQVRQEWVRWFQVRKGTDILFRDEDHMKGMGWFRMMENQQCFRHTQFFGRDEKAHVFNHPSGQEASQMVIELHLQSPKTTFPSSIDVMQTRLSTGTPMSCKQRPSSFKNLLDQRAYTDHACSGRLRQADEPHNGRAGGEEIIDD